MLNTRDTREERVRTDLANLALVAGALLVLLLSSCSWAPARSNWCATYSAQDLREAVLVRLSADGRVLSQFSLALTGLSPEDAEQIGIHACGR